MSGLDKAVAELQAKRTKEETERRARLDAASAFLQRFFETDVATSKALRDNGVQAAFDGTRMLLRRPEEGVYAEGMLIVVGEQGEIDVSGRSLGPVTGDERDDAKKKELISEIISHFSL